MVDEKTRWFNKLYEIYCDEMKEEIKVPLEEVEFNDQLQNLVREEAHRL